MPNKTAILENVDMYSADELVKYIKDGTVTFDELCNDTDGAFAAHIRKEVKKKLEGSEEEDWQKAMNSRSMESLEAYLSAYPTGNHREEARALIRSIQNQESVATSISAWEDVDKNSIDSLQEFCPNNPGDVHVREARKLINKLQKDELIGFDIESLISRIKNIQADRSVLNADDEIFKTIENYYNRKKISESDILAMIREDHNVLRASVINKLIEEGFIGYADLQKSGIKDKFISHLAEGISTQGFAIPEKLDRINKVSTEVYFWGIPSSGKSCALGAILSVAGNGTAAMSMKKDNDCQGYGYMTRLATLFDSHTKVCTLPEGTSIYSTYEMGFDLTDNNNATHPLTCIDLAGELVRCMYKSDAGENLTEDEEEALDTLTRVLIDNRSTNRKMHYFVLEYGADDRKYEGLSQKVYLEGALRYIERTGIFKKDTDAIFLMITKVDKANTEQRPLNQILQEYIQSHYLGFYNGLKKICKDCEINNGTLDIVPFSLGEVCFQDYCLFNEAAAKQVVLKLIERTKGFKNSRVERIKRGFKK